MTTARPEETYNGAPLPPGLRLATLMRVPQRHRDDALQEAWVAHLEGRKPRRGVTVYVRRETTHEKREVAASQAG